MTTYANRWPLLAAIAGGGGAAAGLVSIGAGWSMASLGGLAATGSVAALAGFAQLKRDHHRLASTLAHVQGELADLRTIREALEARLAEAERKAAESPALVWRAATADIEVLGGLLSDLAHTVAQQEARVDELKAAVEALPQAAAAPPQPAPILVPDVTPAVVPATAPPAATPLTEFRSTLANVLTSDRLELCLQPIVTLPQRRTVGYEATLRLTGEDGSIRTTSDLRRIATATGMTFDLDEALIERIVRVLRVLRARDKQVMMVIEVSASTLVNRQILETLAAQLQGDDRIGREIVLATPAEDLRQAAGAPGTAAAETLLMLRQLGPVIGAIAPFGQTLDVRPLAALGVGQMRIDGATLLAAIETNQPYGDIHAADVAQLLRRSGIDLALTGIQDDDIVRDVLDQEISFAQGDLFGGFRPVRPEVLEPRPVVEPAAPATPEPEAQPAQPRQSFRALLRRA